MSEGGLEGAEKERVTFEIEHAPFTASSEGWAEIKHKSPLYDSPFQRDFIILLTKVERESDFEYAVTQYVELIEQDEDEVLEWLDEHESVSEAYVASRRVPEQ